MKTKRTLARMALIAMIAVLASSAWAAYLRDVPQTLVQPNKLVIQCFASGDEYFNWAHDANGFVIIQDPANGYYKYAVEANGALVPSKYVVGKVDPAAVGLVPNIKPSREWLQARIQSRLSVAARGAVSAAPSSGTINNIVIFIRFSGETEFGDTKATYETMFNNTAAGANSMRNYYQEASYGALTISTMFYPVVQSMNVGSWQDTAHTRGYFEPYNATTNPIGYQTGAESAAREFKLLKDAVDGVSWMIVADGLNIDGDGDGKVDNVCFIIRGSAGNWADLLWPHHWELSGENAMINGKRVWDFNLQLQYSLASSGVGVLCHEMFHSMGAPDLYHYDNCSSNTSISPAWRWDIMDNDRNPPQHMCAYMKYRYGKWIASIPEITAPGTYTLNPLTSSTGNCFKIKSPNTSDEYFVVEYRKKMGAFENSLPDSGLLVWRIRPSLGGNACGPPDGVYLYRPGGTTAVNGNPANAAFSVDLGRTKINDTTDPSSFLTDGSAGGLQICGVGTRGDTISFQVNQALCDLKICKYDDRNLNGKFDPGEGVGNWPFRAKSLDDEFTATTGPDGCVTLQGIPANTYTVGEQVSTPDSNGNFTFNGKRWHAFSPTTQSVTIDCGEVKEVDFRNVCLASISVTEFEDKNMDGSRQGGENGISGWPLKLTGTRADNTPVSLSATTDGSGQHVFDDLYPGTYAVSEEGGSISWQKVSTTCGSAIYCDWRASEGGKRWQSTLPRPPDDCSGGAVPAYAGLVAACNEQSVTFANVCLGEVKATKFEDCGMVGSFDPDDDIIEGWPFTLSGTRLDGGLVCSELATDDDGLADFKDVPPGHYTLSEEGGGIVWEKVPTTCGSTTYCDYRTTWQGRRYQSTTPTPPSDCSGPSSPQQEFTLNSCTTTEEFFGNVPLAEVKAFKFHDLNMNKTNEPAGEAFVDANGDGVWTPGEAFTDLNCNGRWDPGEYFDDANGNGVYDKAEEFTDTDGDKVYDWPECPIPNWPFALTGTRADGRPVCAKGSTGADGWVTFADVAPSSPNDYTLAEDLTWCTVTLPTGKVERTTYSATPACTGTTACTVDRWQATTDIERTFGVSCGLNHQEQFGNICLTRIDGVKEVYDDGMPGQAAPKPGVGWKIDLAGKDVLGRDVVPSGAPCSLLPAAAQAPIDIPCQTPKWYETVTDADGKFAFVDLLPGHYHLMEQPNADYKLAMDNTMLSGSDLMCCPRKITLQNIKKGLSWNVYQAVEGDSKGAGSVFAGLNPNSGDVVTAVPGVLAIDPGTDWSNYKQATELCRESVTKDAVLTKKFAGLVQCTEVFGPRSLSQKGSSGIRLWWPLMFEPPTTTWTLDVMYATKRPVKLPGETFSGIAHKDEWKWFMDADFESVTRLMAVFHELPFGTCEVPLISDELLYTQLLADWNEIQDLATPPDEDPVAAGLALFEFEMSVAERCITSCDPGRPIPTGASMGIANTYEYPACCKLMVDSEYIAKKYGLWGVAK